LRSTTPPGWVWLVASAVLVYVPVWLVQAAVWLVDRVRDVDDNLAEMGGDDDG